MESEDVMNPELRLAMINLTNEMGGCGVRKTKEQTEAEREALFAKQSVS